VKPLAPITRSTKIKLAAYGVLLLTLFLPFSRCSHGAAAPAPAASAPTSPTRESPTPTSGESPTITPETPSTPPMPSATPIVTPSPWYHLFERNIPEAQYKYGMDLLIESWAVPTTLPKEFSVMMLIPGRMFYVWPLATLALALWWPPVRWKRSFHFIEFALGLGGIWWAFMAVFWDDVMRGFYLAASALALYALTALYEGIAEWRRLRRERKAALPLAE
jgi:hypothetical protein